MLTKLQYTVMHIIKGYQEKYQNFPNMPELAKACGKKNKNGLCYLINELVNSGYLDRLGHGSYVIKNQKWENEKIKPNQEDIASENAIRYYKKKHGI
jgi:predicted transcriptional regulator of viral defense system